MVRALRTRGALAAVSAVAATVAAIAPAAGAQDFGGFRNVLPAGQGQTANALDFAGHQAGSTPRPFVDQLPLYTGLLRAAPALTAQDLDRYFKPASFGVAPSDVTNTITPREGVTIRRDAFHVPHVEGATRADAAWGVGYATAQDRLFAMDVLRHYGRGRLSELAGPGVNEITLKDDIVQIKAADYTEAELNAMLERAIARAGPEGPVLRSDGEAYVDGINAYIREAREDPTKMPAEYALLGAELHDWTPADSVAVGSLIGGIFGRGGGEEVKASQVLQAAYARFGARRARAVFDDFRRIEDPETAFTVAQRFRYPDPGGRPRRGAVALPDLGSVVETAPTRERSESAARTPPASVPSGLRFDGIGLGGHASNALLVAGRHSQSGRPIAVMGPQVGFYSPQIVMEVDVHGGGLDVRGMTFPGASPYVLIGRGSDFAWSATTATSDNVDQFVERLCEPDGSRPSLKSTHYLYKGRCIALSVRDHVIRTTPNLSDTTPATTYRLRLERSVHGPIQGRATVRGQPVAYASARSTYLNEAESLLAFKRLNDGTVRDARSFQRAIARINFAFNWFYVDDRDIAYQLSGWYPLRARGTDPSLPAWGTGRYDWRRFDAQTFASRRASFRQLPKAINPGRGYILSWNNRQAPGWRASDMDWYFSSVHRDDLLERTVRAGLAGGRKLDLAGLVRAVELPATQDLRGVEVYPWIRRALGRVADPVLADALARLDRWRADGAHRRDLDGDNFYEHSPAVALMDAWWEPLVRGMFEPVAGREMVARVRSMLTFSRTPNLKLATEGSSFSIGWYGHVEKDLRTVLHRPVRGRFSRVYCGRGSRIRCRAILQATLRDAIAAAERKSGTRLDAIKVPATCGPRAPGLETGAPLACDQTVFRSIGAVGVDPIPHQNRPTFQQAVEVQGHRPR